MITLLSSSSAAVNLIASIYLYFFPLCALFSVFIEYPELVAIVITIYLVEDCLVVNARDYFEAVADSQAGCQCGVSS